LIAAFANTDGGFIVLGVAENGGEIIINGLSEDFQANSITHKAIDLLTPKPQVSYDYISHDSKRLYVIKVLPSASVITIENKIFKRRSATIFQANPDVRSANGVTISLIQDQISELDIFTPDSTGAKQG
jgi:predicted HTH transcriptional regulator